MSEGTLITLEGIDGAGKSTVINALKEEFTGVKTLFTSEPQENQYLGRVLRQCLSDEDMDDMALFFLFLSEHAQHVADYIDPALEEGRLVVSDRYIDSRYAYQTYGLRDHVDGDAFEWIQSIQQNGWSTLPDKTIILDISVDTSLERIAGNEKEVFENRDRLEAARDIYLSLADEHERYEIVDAEQSPEDVIEDCLNIIYAEH